MNMQLRGFTVENIDEGAQLFGNALELSSMRMTADTIKGQHASVLTLSGAKSQVEFETLGDRGLRKGVRDTAIAFQGSVAQINDAMEPFDILTFPQNGSSETKAGCCNSDFPRKHCFNTLSFTFCFRCYPGIV